MGSRDSGKYYCEKCGDLCLYSLKDYTKETCFMCQSIGFFKKVPKEYLDSAGILLRDEEEFLEKVVKVSPNFDQSCLDLRLKREKFFREKSMKEYLNKQANVPKCPTCSSTNLRRISFASKAANTYLFGIFGTKRDKTFHCNNCGYEW